MNHSKETLRQLEAAPSPADKTVLVGMDGFVDKIVHPVDKRSGPGDHFTAIPTINDFASRIASASGKSANIELAPVVEKLGGNGPIMAHALLAEGFSVRYVGALGKKNIHPVFREFARQTNAASIADPGVTHAAEFRDGKIMFGSMASLEEITYEGLRQNPQSAAIAGMFSEADLIALVNWTMVPHLSDVFRGLLDDLLPGLPEKPGRRFFFDLADPEKRATEDLREALALFSRFEEFGRVTLGLNLREAEQVDTLLGFSPLDPTPGNLRELAARIRRSLNLDSVVVHPTTEAACATPEGTAHVQGPYCQEPKITTGAGDHFNAGFAAARLLDLPPETALTLAVATSGLYVRTGSSPSLGEAARFIASW